MNNEEKTNEAEPKKPGDLTDSIARMTACLEDVIANAKAALDQAQNMNRDGMKWITLSKAVFDVNKRSRMGWQGLVDPAAGTGGGAFFTKNDILDFVLANPPMVDIQPADEPIDPKAPKLVRGDGPVWPTEPDSVGMARHGGVIQAWAIQDGSGVQVFAKQMFKDGKYIDCWNVTATIDCEKAIIATVFGGRNRMNAIARFLRNGLISSRMSARHKRMNKKARANIERGDLCHED